MFRDLSLGALDITATQAEQIELTLSHGFRGTDLNIVEFHQRAETHGLPHARRLYDSAKIRLSEFALPFDPAADDSEFQQGLKQLEPLAQTAAEVGCVRAVTQLAPASDERPYHENFEFYRRRYNEIGAVLAPHGISLGIAFCSAPSARAERSFEFIHGFDALALLMATVQSRNVGMVVDLYDLWRSGGKVDDIRKLTPTQIVQVRVSDAPASPARDELTADQRQLPGSTGIIDVAAALTLLAEMGYDGPITPNPGRAGLGSISRDGFVRQVGQALDQVWKAAGLSPAGKLSPVRK
jgi:sugar phosphate isomerase/epimerase